MKAKRVGCKFARPVPLCWRLLFESPAFKARLARGEDTAVTLVNAVYAWATEPSEDPVPD